jgi:hypothetical protein
MLRSQPTTIPEDSLTAAFGEAAAPALNATSSTFEIL